MVNDFDCFPYITDLDWKTLQRCLLAKDLYTLTLAK